MNILETQVSFYEHFSDTKAPKTGTFLQVVTSAKLAAKHGPLLSKIRVTEDKKERDPLKKKLACFQPSGLFSERNEAGLKAHSKLLQFDIDPAQNPWLNAETAPALRDELSKLKQVAYCSLSASWKGVWGVVPIEQPDHHKEHFEALKADFEGWGIVIDPACSNVAHLRFWSYDPDQYINQNAAAYTKLIYPQPTYTTRQTGQRWHSERPEDLAQQAVEYLIQNRVSLECTYTNFMRIAFACKHEWSEAGKGIALDILHACTTFAQSNTARNFDSLWKNIRRDGGNVTTAGTLVNWAKERGFKYQPTKQPDNAPQPPTAAPPTPNGLPPGYRREHLTDRETGQAIDVLLNADGYPASWDRDLDKPQRESLAKIIQAQPDMTELIVRFALKLDTIEAGKPWEQWQTESAQRHERCRRWYPAAYGIDPAKQPAHITRRAARGHAPP
jgi:hypothetical protein